MNADTYTTRRPSCLRRLLGTVTAFALAAAFVYVASYVIIFQVLGLPARNETGWLGPTLRFLQTGSIMERGGTNFYRGDTKPYEVFKPLNKLWLRTQTLPDMPAAGPGADDSDIAGGDTPGEARRGRRGGEGRSGAEGRPAGGETTSTARRERPGRTANSGARAPDEETTGSEEPFGRRGRRAPADAETTAPEEQASRGSADEKQTTTPEGRRPRRRPN